MNGRSGLVDGLLGLVSNGLILRDRILGVTRGLRTHALAEPHSFASGSRRLAAAYVPPAELAPAVLICHGIGETVQQWSGVQALFRDHGIGSLVFNYSGYGRSTGRVRVKHCDEDFQSAYAELLRLLPSGTPIYVLGFSLGTGIASAGVAALRPAPAGLFLCEAFDSFHNAARAAGVPRWLSGCALDIWKTADNLRSTTVPIYAVHSDADKLFPVSMPRRIVEACGAEAELLVVKGLNHDQPYREVVECYWLPIIERMSSPGRLAKNTGSLKE